MWCRLLDIAEPNRKTNAKTAEKLLPDWDCWILQLTIRRFRFWVALDDERLYHSFLKARTSTDCSSMFWRSVGIVGMKRWRGIVWTLH